MAGLEGVLIKRFHCTWSMAVERGIPYLSHANAIQFSLKLMLSSLEDGVNQSSSTAVSTDLL